MLKLETGVIALGLLASLLPAQADSIQTPEQFFGFKIGSDGEMARYPKVLEYLQHLAGESPRMSYRELGKTTDGNPYVLTYFSSPENLERLERLTAINNLLADPRKLQAGEAEGLIEEGRPFYFLYATIHSTEVGNGQTITEIAHEMVTSNNKQVAEILENTVLLMVPSQNPDGQMMVIDHYYKHRGTRYSTGFPDLYHRYTGHDNNRDWFMFTQIETRLNVEKVQNTYRPAITHDMHQMGSNGFRIFVPPFIDPYDRNFHPILSQAQASVGMAMATGLVAAGKEGVGFLNQYDLWTPARQYMIYHGQPRILTEIASVHLAMPQIDPTGKPLGPQETRWNFPAPYSSSEWRLRDIVDYGKIAVFSGLSHVAKYRREWLRNFYKVHEDWVTRTESPFAFVIPANQRDPFETFELLEILDIADVEIHRAEASFQADGEEFAAGSWVVKLAQPYGAFAKTMLEIQEYPDLRAFPGGPPIPPYDVTAQTLGMLMGVDVRQIEGSFDAQLRLLAGIKPAAAPAIDPGATAYLIDPGSNAAFKAVPRLQAAGIPLARSSSAFVDRDQEFPAGTWLIPGGPKSHEILAQIATETGLVVSSSSQLPAVDSHLLSSPTRVGLWRGANNMPGGWMMWLFEQYGIEHRIVSAEDFRGDLSDKYDVIVLPAGISRRTILRGLDRRFHDESWDWAYGVGQQGWDKLRDWVLAGGSIIANGDSVETVRSMFDLPIAPVLPLRSGRGQSQAAVADAEVNLRETFQSPANLLKTLEERVVNRSAQFFCPGSLLYNEFDPEHPVAYGMPATAPVFFRHAQAYRLTPGFDAKPRAVSRYPAEGPILASGWLLGEERLRDQANAVAFDVGKGKVVTLASQIAFRTQTRGTFKLLFNAIFHGPARAIDAAELGKTLSRGN